ncbi:MAG: response regulator [Chloroflexi bacterium]|nr:response regulator [Chloroflexota bacterium]
MSSLRSDSFAGCILVIDDDRQIRQAIRWALEDEGFAVLAAAGGADALRLTQERTPDLVLLDFTLSEQRGDEVAVALRAAHSRPLPILLITGDGEAASKAQKVGAYGFVRKPFELDELLDAIAHGLSQSD